MCFGGPCLLFLNDITELLMPSQCGASVPLQLCHCCIVGPLWDHSCNCWMFYWLVAVPLTGLHLDVISLAMTPWFLKGATSNDVSPFIQKWGLHQVPSAARNVILSVRRSLQVCMYDRKGEPLQGELHSPESPQLLCGWLQEKSHSKESVRFHENSGEKKKRKCERMRRLTFKTGVLRLWFLFFLNLRKFMYFYNEHVFSYYLRLDSGLDKKMLTLSSEDPEAREGFTHSLIQHWFIENLLCAWTCYWDKGYD